jgi:DNA polymerase III delta prime subunit
MLWVEKYRPQLIADCVLPNRIKKTFQAYVDAQEIPNLLLSGGPGIGKTSTAKAMCDQAGVTWSIIPASDERGIDTFRTKILGFATTKTLLDSGKKKVLILDEADFLTTDCQAALRGALEEYVENCTFILTCNYKNKLMKALHSRCAVIDFSLESSEKPKMAAAIFKRITSILDSENITYNQDVVGELVKKYFPDYRRTINEIQRIAKFGPIDTSALVLVREVVITDLIKAMKNKDWAEARKWAGANSDQDPSVIYRKIYDNIEELIKTEAIPQAVLILAKYQYQATQVPDQEINMAAFLTELMVDCT